MLAASGSYEVETAGSASQALARVMNPALPRFDCFLLDIQMPRMDGVELCRSLRAIPLLEHVPILMITAMSDKGYVDRAFHAGATDYVTKPFDMADLRMRLANAVSARLDENGKPRRVFAVTRPIFLEDQEMEKVNLQEPVTIMDVDGVISQQALENYISQLSRSALYGSTVFGFSIRRIAELYHKSTAFGFECLITDTSEAISDCLKPHQYLLAYGGNGTFVCVTEGGYKPDLDALTDAINRRLHEMDLYFCNGEKLNFRVCAGKPVRLVWRNGRGVLDAITQAFESAEDEALKREDMIESLWLRERIA
jgi:CheY-like chemotaxis protein